MRFNNKKIRILICGIALLMGCIVFLCFAPETNVRNVEENKAKEYLLLSAFVADDKDPRNRPQQAIILFDMESMDIADMITVTDGSALLCCNEKIYSVAGPGYGIFSSNSYGNEITRPDHVITEYALVNGKLSVDRRQARYVYNGDMILKLKEDDMYLLESYDEYNFMLTYVGEGKTVKIDLGRIFDEFSGWSWPCDNISINDNGKTAILAYDSWGGKNRLSIASFEEGSIGECYEDYVRGPLYWINDCDLLVWEKNPDQKPPTYTAAIYDVNKKSITDRLFDIERPPFTAITYSNGDYVFWAGSTTGPDLMLYREGSGLTSLLHFNIDSSGDYWPEVASTECGDMRLLIPFEYYQPTLSILRADCSEK